jgi:glutathione S-transferase
MRVPVLAVGDEIITELPAILTAISQLAPQVQLLGSNGMETVRAYEWLNWLSGTLHGQAFGALWRPQRFTSDPKLFEDLKQHASITIRECFNHIESQISSVYSVGTAFTAVDAFLLVFWRWGTLVGIDMKNYPKYSALASAVLSRSSTQAALEAERAVSKI